ncbi:MAG: T9SS type A sorting domain-containing protein [Tannerella sp.]|jgi:hypothetical protein|nr:T9SS type A sorting domain-containing protein [Tannerella sp.]
MLKNFILIVAIALLCRNEVLFAQDYAFTDDMPKAGLGPVPRPSDTAPWHSGMLSVDEEGRLVYFPDADGFILPDFSNAGYRNGDEPIPEVPVIKIIEPVSGDNTQHIQNAINETASFSPDENGIRGALLLKKGLYPVVGPIYLNVEGVVLRGEGNTGDPSVSTVIYDTYKDPAAASGRVVLVLGNKSSDDWNTDKNNETNIIDNIVPVGSYKVHIAKNENYRAGDMVCIYHPCSAAWLQAVDYGQTYTPGGQPEGAWTASSAPIYYHRYVKNVVHEGAVTEITLDAPVFYTLNRSLSQCTIYRFKRSALQNIGIENLRIDIANKGIPDDYHAWDAVNFCNMENGWAKNVVVLHFGASGFETMRSTRLTIENCYALDPAGTVTGGMGYNFCTYQRSQLILFKNCYARAGRHNYISNGISATSGCVVLRCKSEGSRASSEGHRIWTQGMLFDCHEDFNPISSSTVLSVLGFYNRMDMGSGHGWAMAHGVMWNCNVQTDRNTPGAIANSPSKARSVIYCEKPPTAQNYAIGCITHQASDVRAYKYQAGYIEGSNKPGLYPESLYEAQFAERHRDVPLRIIKQPQNTEACSGSLLQLSVEVDAPDMSSVTCQWRKDGVNINGKTGRVLSVGNASVEDAGNYSVSVSCRGKSVISETAVVSIVKSLPEQLQWSGFPVSFQTGSTYYIYVADPVDGAYEGVTAYQWTYSGSGISFARRTANPVEMTVGNNATDGVLSVRIYHPCGQKTLEHNIFFSGTGDGNDHPGENNILVYPNPLQNLLHVKNIRTANCVRVVNMKGQVVYSQTLNGQDEITIPVYGYQQGNYILQISTLEENFSFKLIK